MAAVNDIGEALFAPPLERLIGLSRFVFAGLALIAAHFDPGQEAYGQLSYATLYAYFLYSGVLAAASYGRPPGLVAQIIQHAVDIATVAMVMHFTVGPTSPFFLFFTFALLTATLRWNWQGAVATAAVLVIGFLLYSALSGAGFQEIGGRLYEPMIRGTYLFVAGIMLAYVGVFRQRSRDRLAQLAAWPPEEASLSDEPQLCRSLAHAALVLRSDRVLVVWEDADEPHIRTVLWRPDGCVSSRDWPVGFREFVGTELEAMTFMSPGPAHGWVESKSGRRHVTEPVIAADLVRAFDMKAFATAPFDSGRYRGRVFILEPRHPSEGLLLLTEIVALRIGVELEHFGLRRDLASAARAQERAQLARDIHDSILQDLAAADLQLKAVLSHIPGDARPQLIEIGKLISSQQRRIRSFVDTVTQKSSFAGPIEFSRHVRSFAKQLEEQWKCQVEIDLDPPDLQASADLSYHICLMLAEATANAVRHGGASRIGVLIRRGGQGLEIAIGDNGRGLAEPVPQSRFSPERTGPNSLRQRVQELGGSLKLDDSPVGLGLSIRLPVPS